MYVIYETYTNGYSDGFLDFFSLISILSGIFTILSKNPIISVLYLIALFLSIASYLMIIGINFIGLSYLLVYIGAVSILFIFILMLINVRISELMSNTSNSIPLAIITSILFNYPLYQILPYILTVFSFLFLSLNNINNFVDYTLYKSLYLFKDNYNDQISFVTSNSWEGNLSETSHITNIGNIMYTNYSIWLIITSIILLLAMVGAIVITIKQEN